jgi:alpha-beta hydrolase superfamily lysophospholipase
MAGAAGTEIYWQSWVPDGEPRASLVIAHGFGEHSARYAHVGEKLAGGGYAVYALDHRGHGRSQGKRAMLEQWDRVLEDVGTLIGTARERHPEAPVFLLGHSLGGAVALSFALRHQDQLAGLALSGAVSAMEVASPALRVASKVLSRVAPGLGVYKVDSALVSRDAEVVRAYDADPLVHHGKMPARTAGELTAAVDAFEAALPGLRIPLLLMHGGDDAIVPPSGTEMVAERAGSDDKTLKLYPGLYHEILNEPEQDEVIRDLLDWLNAHVRTPALPPT